MNRFPSLLSGGDLRSIGKNNDLLGLINQASDFDELFGCLFHPDRIVVMRAADLVEKVTATYPQYLAPHKKDVLSLCDDAHAIELKWHLALLIPRLPLSPAEAAKSARLLLRWASDTSHSRIVRVNALQGLYELALAHPVLRPLLMDCLSRLDKENIPSLNARVRKIWQKLHE